MSDKFLNTRNTPFSLGEEWCLGRACLLQDMKQKVCCGKRSVLCTASDDFGIGPY